MKPITPTLKKMDIQDKEIFPIEKMKSIRSICTDLKIVFGKKFRTKQINDKRLIEVTRVS